MQKKLQQVLSDLTEISGLRFALYRTPEEYVAGTWPEDACDQEQIAGLFAQVTEDRKPLLTVYGVSGVYDGRDGTIDCGGCIGGRGYSRQDGGAHGTVVFRCGPEGT